ncbi:DUF2213 domain-containing protein [Orenia marismortui]|uniref:DUF2213 domain-containing protein n=1 Tax=Orenia marismortui TaxID=46469 RepID=UPI00037CC514|nr:DUF2213 domain-containing protein [Orenia marismortui]
MAERFDSVEVENVKKNDAGFLTYDLLAAQTGVFPYRDYATGEIVYELKHPDDLLTDEVLEQLNNLPICNEHPFEFVNTENSTELVKGLTGQNAKVDDNKLANNATVFDGNLIAAIVTGDKRECSLGFTCEIVDESGEFEGQHYDRRQTNFKLNHLAMVPKGRCGSDCFAKLDSEDGEVRQDSAYQVREDNLDNNKKGSGKMAVIKLDNKEFEVDEAVKARLDSLESNNKDLTKEVGQLEGKVDAQNDTIKQLKEDKAELEGNQIDSETLQKKIDERLALLEDAKLFLDSEYDFTDKETKDIKIDCIKAVNDSFDPEGRSDDYIDARFDAMIEMASEGSTGDNNLRYQKKKQDGDDSSIQKKKNKRLNLKK